MLCHDKVVTYTIRRYQLPHAAIAKNAIGFWGIWKQHITVRYYYTIYIEFVNLWLTLPTTYKRHYKQAHNYDGCD